MSSNPAVAQLIERLEQANDGSRELDWDVAVHLGLNVVRKRGSEKMSEQFPFCLHGPGGVDSIPKFTTSVDAALTLVLPEGWHFALARDPNGGFIAVVDADGSYIGDTLYYPGATGGETPALALCPAALKARQSQGR